MTRDEALSALLAKAPPSKLPVWRIGHKPFIPGKGDPELIKRDLGTAYVAWRRMAWGPDISCVVSVRRHNVVRRWA